MAGIAALPLLSCSSASRTFWPVSWVPAYLGTVQVVPRTRLVGDGFRVYTYFPGHGGEGISQRRLSPFLLLDFNAEIDFSPSETVRGVAAHPHKGFETVTIAYKGSVSHHDSAGHRGTIHAGDVQWMTAGGGVLHKEYHEKNFDQKGGAFEMEDMP